MEPCSSSPCCSRVNCIKKLTRNEMSRIGKAIETESRLVVVEAEQEVWGDGTWLLTLIAAPWSAYFCNFHFIDENQKYTQLAHVVNKGQLQEWNIFKGCWEGTFSIVSTHLRVAINIYALNLSGDFCITNILCFKQGQESSHIESKLSHIETKFYITLGHILLSIWRCGYCIHNKVCNSGDEFQNLHVIGVFSNEMDSCMWILITLLNSSRSLAHSICPSKFQRERIKHDSRSVLTSGWIPFIVFSYMGAEFIHNVSKMVRNFFTPKDC